MAKITDHCAALQALAEQHPEHRDALHVAASALLFIESRKLESAFALELASWAGEDGESEEAMLERQRAAARAVLGSARSAAR